jgi:hypothetical protein
LDTILVLMRDCSVDSSKKSSVLIPPTRVSTITPQRGLIVYDAKGLRRNACVLQLEVPLPSFRHLIVDVPVQLTPAGFGA